MNKWIGIRLAAVIAVFLVLAFLTSKITPFNEGPDEGINLDYIEFIMASGRLPITYDEREQVGPKANWPALYHLTVGGLGNALDIDIDSPPYIKIYWDSYRYRAIDVESENAWYLLAEDQEWPYYGRILVFQIGRWLSILFSVITLILVFLTVVELSPAKPWLALVAMALLAFTPAFISIGSALNEDALVGALAALYFWMLVRVVKDPQKLWPYWVMGLALGLSVTVKYTTVVLPLEIILVTGVIVRQRKYDWGWWLLRLGIVGGCAVLASAWWFGWNFWHLNEVEELGLVAGLLRPLFTGGTDVTLARLGHFFSGGQIGLADLPENTRVGTFPRWIELTFLSFWGVERGGIIPLLLILGIAFFGLWRLWKKEFFSRHWLVLLIFHIGIFLVAPLVRFGLSRRLGQTAQGRHILIPAATAIVVLLVWGIISAIPQKWQRPVFSAIILGFMSWTGMYLYQHMALPSPPLPFRTLPQAAERLPDPVNVQFADKIELVSYEISPQLEHGLLNVSLAWRSLDYVNENYLLRINLVDDAGQIVAHWVGYNGQGRVPTLAWDPGDSVFDRLVLPLPNLPEGNYQLQVQMLANTGPLTVNNADQSNTVPLAQVSIEEPSVFSYPYQMTLVKSEDDSVEIAYAIWRSNGPVEASEKSYFRYPATISVIVSDYNIGNAQLAVQLVDSSGHEWAATRVEANTYAFIIGPRWQSDAYRVRMVLQQDDETIASSIGDPVLEIENWWERQFEVPEIEVPLEANFANQLHLLGYKLPQRQVEAGKAFPITFYWQASLDKSPQANFIQFNNLLDSTGTPQGGYDRRPLEYYSTLLWAPGEIVVDGYAVPVGADASPGEYYLDVGYYLVVGESAVNLPLVVNGEMTEVSSVTVGPIEVVAP